MIGIKTFTYTFAVPYFLPLLLAVPQAQAQSSAEVAFEPGNYGTMLSGTLTGDAYMDYYLGASGGQELFVDLSVSSTDGTGSVYLNVLPPGSTGEAIYVGSMDEDSSETVPLPEDGTYTIRVYLMGNDRDAGKTVGYNLDVSIQ
ncbi:hypothetical protein [Alloyangia pacifica]|uniref:hypothetical protein n=1 Tax=Alloyangia pacifica TaxID=311180 RepID=UPI001CFE99F9|nr:hypothetical protein [Alloyangia pacifica]